MTLLCEHRRHKIQLGPLEPIIGSREMEVVSERRPSVFDGTKRVVIILRAFEPNGNDVWPELQTLPCGALVLSRVRRLWNGDGA